MDTPEKKVADQKPAPQVQKDESKKTEGQKRRTGTLMLIAGGLVILALGFGAGWLSRNQSAHQRLADFGQMHNTEALGGNRPMMKHAFGGGDVNATDGSEVSHLTGVVTQVNGDTFTIAGNGTTKTIKTDGNTNYNVSSNKVSVNDSVIVRGTQSGDIFTASSVNVLNR